MGIKACRISSSPRRRCCHPFHSLTTFYTCNYYVLVEMWKNISFPSCVAAFIHSRGCVCRQEHVQQGKHISGRTTASLGTERRVLLTVAFGMDDNIIDAIRTNDVTTTIRLAMQFFSILFPSHFPNLSHLHTHTFLRMLLLLLPTGSARLFTTYALKTQ
jgi:hypothetical protein